MTIGNGDKLKILSVGNSVPINGNCLLNFDNVSYVPTIAENLASVFKLAKITIFLL